MKQNCVTGNWHVSKRIWRHLAVDHEILMNISGKVVTWPTLEWRQIRRFMSHDTYQVYFQYLLAIVVCLKFSAIL